MIECVISNTGRKLTKLSLKKQDTKAEDLWANYDCVLETFHPMDQNKDKVRSLVVYNHDKSQGHLLLIQHALDLFRTGRDAMRQLCKHCKAIAACPISENGWHCDACTRTWSDEPLVRPCGCTPGRWCEEHKALRDRGLPVTDPSS